MSSRKPSRLSAELDVIPFEFEKPPENFDWVICQKCQMHLCLHQPDSQSPARLLGFCEGCRDWYLILMEFQTSSALMIVIPENRMFHDEWETHGGSKG